MARAIAETDKVRYLDFLDEFQPKTLLFENMPGGSFLAEEGIDL